jgi:hypothetical protein
MRKSTFALLFCCVIQHHTFAAPSQPLSIPLTNAGFEEGMNGWSVWKMFAGQVSVQENIARSGKNSLRIDAQTKADNPLAAQAVTGIQGNATYRLSAWARLAPGSAPVDAAVKIEGYDAAGKNIDQQYGRIHLQDNQQWQQVSVTLPLKADTVRADLLLRVYGKGAALFDDVSLETSGISVVAPTRKALPANSDEKIKYELKLYYPWTEKVLPAITAELSSDGNPVKQISATVEQGRDNQHFFATVPLRLARTGDYQFHFSLEQNGARMSTQFPAEIYTTLPDRKPQFLTDNDTLLFQGKPFFPIGIYHAAFSDSAFQQLAEKGFNAIVSSPNDDMDQLQVTLDRARKYGFAVDVPLHKRSQVAKNLPLSLEKIRRFASHPAVLDWKILDEPEYNLQVAGEIPSVYRAFKAADKNHPFELTLSAAGDLDLLQHFCDIIQRDVYPLPNAPLTRVADVAQATLQSKQPWQNLSFVLQCGWTPDGKTQPTVAQARSMVYLALINGAKGIWWYSMYDPSWDLTKTSLWSHLKEINEEIKVLSQPVMLGQDVNGISCDNPKVHFTAKKYAGKIYLLITNPENLPASATLRLPENINVKNGQMLSEEKSIPVVHHEITLNLKAIDSCTLVLE